MSIISYKIFTDPNQDLKLQKYISQIIIAVGYRA
jgi:hypothetical protein